jgi:glycosyltransferase involved in cell wall biosynthesis
MYVKSRSGWMSDRSPCYLASGRPVIAQDTGRIETYPAGLITFRTPDEAVDAVERVLGDYPRHRRAARDIAESCFDSDRVLARLVDRVLAA